MTNYLQQIMSYFRNKALNAAGAERDLLTLIQDGDIGTAIQLMQSRDIEVDEAISEYYPQNHAVMTRPNKFREGKDPYISEKLPRSRQRYINEVELFFLLGNPILWKKADGDDDAFTLFTEFLKAQRFDANMRKFKRLAGAETEAAKLYHIFRDDRTDEIQVKTVILARESGYRLRPLFDQYGNMRAFAYGYQLNEGGKVTQHWDIQTPDFLFFARKSAIGWEVDTYQNPTGKINIIYARQPKAWDGAEQRLKREEMLDSKVADTNNYFADPIATATADVIQGMLDPEKPGKLIQLTGTQSRFEYVNPPQNSVTRQDEKNDLNDSILFDTFTPDFSFDKIKGMGTLSGDAIKNAMILGFIKRDNRKEIYEELVDREKNIVIAILKYMYPNMAAALDSLVIEFVFSEPFAQDKQKNWQAISQLYQTGLVSLESAVEMLALTDAPEEEIARILGAQQRAMLLMQSASAQKQENPMDGEEGEEER